MAKPSVICITETKVVKTKDYMIEGYKEVLKRNIKKGKGGMMIAVKNNTATGVKETTVSNNPYIMTGEIKYRDKTGRLILCYGPQEDEKADVRKEFYEDLAIEVENSILNGATPVILGDLNAKIKKGEKGDVSAESGNGYLLMHVIEEYQLMVLNFHQQAEGYYTRIITKKGKEEKSCLDYVISIKGVYSDMKSFCVDENKVITPFRTVKRGKNMQDVYSDHCAITITLNFFHDSAKAENTKR